MVLSAREKFLLVILGVAVALTAVYFAAQGLRGYEQRLTARVADRESTLRQVAELNRELDRLKRTPAPKRLKRPLIGNLEELAQRVGVEKRLQLNLVPQDRAKKLEAVEMRVDSMTLDEMLALVHAIEDASPPLVIDNFELSPSFRSQELLRVTMRVLAQK